MDRQGRDHGHVLSHIYQNRADLLPILHQDPSRYGKRAVKPRCHKHTAVLLHVQPYISAVRYSRSFLQLRAGRITVTRHDPQAPVIGFGYDKCNERRSISFHIVLSFRQKLPYPGLLQFRKALGFQVLPRIFDHVICSG